MIRLGLIGDNIAASRAPDLHRLAGRLSGLEVSYERLVPAKIGLGFDAVFDRCAADGFHGLNVTLPYKERVVPRVLIDAPQVRAIGAVNTVRFDADRPKGFNTDHSGFVAACREAFGGPPPGPVCLIGAGGVGKAIAFGLLDLGIAELRLVERDLRKAEALAATLRSARPDRTVEATGDVAAAAAGAAGIVNASPVGMAGYGGTPIPAAQLTGAAWAFDAIYTPIETSFLRDAAAAGARTVSGYELFVHQGLHAFEIFCGRRVEAAALRAALSAAIANPRI